MAVGKTPGGKDADTIVKLPGLPSSFNYVVVAVGKTRAEKVKEFAGKVKEAGGNILQKVRRDENNYFFADTHAGGG